MEILNQWSQTLEQVARDRVDDVADWAKRYRTLEWAPPSANSYRSYDGMPSVLVVATSPNRGLHHALFSAVEILQESTYAFRTIVFCDAASVNDARGYDFAIDSCFDEWNWLKFSNASWLKMAARRLRDAIGIYGVQHLIAVEDTQSLDEALDEVAARFGASSAALDAARMAAHEHLEKLRIIEEAPQLVSLRGPSARRAIESGELVVSCGDIKELKVRHVGTNEPGCYITSVGDEATLDSLRIATAQISLEVAAEYSERSRRFENRVRLAAMGAVSEIVKTQTPRFLDQTDIIGSAKNIPAEVRIRRDSGDNYQLSTNFGAEASCTPEGFPSFIRRLVGVFDDQPLQAADGSSYDLEGAAGLSTD